MANTTGRTADAIPDAPRRPFPWPILIGLILMLAGLVQFVKNLPPDAIDPKFRFQFSKQDTVSLETQMQELPVQLKKNCPLTPFTSVQILSRNPQIILIENFITPAEAMFLVKIADPLFKKSTVVSSSDDIKPDTVQKDYRDSLSAHLKLPATPAKIDEDIVVSCIEQRAAHFQGFVPVENLETLQVVKFTPNPPSDSLYCTVQYYDNGQVKPHFDWLPDTVPSMQLSGNRLSSFFIYLEVNCTGGTTAFPRVARPASHNFCENILKCEEDGNDVPWLEVKPQVGRAIFWYNLDTKGEREMRSLHAGAEVISGTKVGLNIWTRERNWRKRDV